MGETTETKGAPPVTGQSSNVKEGSTSQPETYTREQIQKFVSDALAEQGRKHKSEFEPVAKERDTYKSQLQAKENELAGLSDERGELQKRIDELSSNDPEVFNLVKKDRELRERERQLKTGVQELEAEKQSHAERIKLADDTLREISIFEIASKYDGGNPVKLKDLCDTFGAKSEEQIIKVAENLWAKKLETPTTEETQPIKPYSGVTSGGGIDINALSPDEKIKYALEHSKKK